MSFTAVPSVMESLPLFMIIKVLLEKETFAVYGSNRMECGIDLDYYFLFINRKAIISLGEGNTPLVQLRQIAKRLGIENGMVPMVIARSVNSYMIKGGKNNCV